MPSGHKAFLVHNITDVNLLLMHNREYAAEYVLPAFIFGSIRLTDNIELHMPCLHASESKSSQRQKLSASRSPTPKPRLLPNPRWELYWLYVVGVVGSYVHHGYRSLSEYFWPVWFSGHLCMQKK
jgi:hypothetical protein